MIKHFLWFSKLDPLLPIRNIFRSSIKKSTKLAICVWKVYFQKVTVALKTYICLKICKKTSFYFKEHLLIRKFVIQILKVLFSPPKCFCFWLVERNNKNVLSFSSFLAFTKNQRRHSPMEQTYKVFQKNLKKWFLANSSSFLRPCATFKSEILELSSYQTIWQVSNFFCSQKSFHPTL